MHNCWAADSADAGALLKHEIVVDQSSIVAHVVAVLTEEQLASKLCLADCMVSLSIPLN